MKVKASALAIFLVLGAAIPAFADFFQGFETNTAGWWGATRVESGTNGVTSKAGAWHAEDPYGGAYAYTRWGGYSATFPPGGYTTSLDIYLDFTPGVPGDYNATRFDWSSAVGTPGCALQRDFIFNAGLYTDQDGTNPRFVISASNNVGADPQHSARPLTITAEGWYTFEHRFYALPPAPGGQLFVDLTIKVDGEPLMTWTLTDPSDLVGTTVGGNQYGRFLLNEFPYLGFDNSALVGFQDYCVPPQSTAGAKVTAGGWIPVDPASDGKATFGLTAKVKADGTPSGHLTYQDHFEGRSIKSTAITAVVVDGNCVDVFGMATDSVNGAVKFQVRVCDNGEPGRADTFGIVTSSGYERGDTLGGGNVQNH